MAIRREFLGWDRPLLPTAAAWLIAERRRASHVDLRSCAIVLPGRRAGRRLLELLVQQAAAAGLSLAPPTITTEGRFPELLYTPQRPFANAATQQLVWARALEQTPEEIRRRVVPHPPAEDALDRWLALGEMIGRQHTQLAADGLDFADVARQGASLAGFDERPRWEALAHIQRLYLDALDTLQLWDIQTARLVAIEKREPVAQHDIILIGAVDLNGALRQMLNQVADRVTALIGAPRELEAAFDAHGCLLIPAWNDRPLPFREEQIILAQGPAEQAEEVACRLAQWAPQLRAEEVTIGVADETLIPQLQRQLAECGVPTRWVAGRELHATAPFRFLVAAAEYAEGKSYPAFASLVRHPDVFAWLQQRRTTIKAAPCLLTTCDEFFNERLPRRMPDDWDSLRDRFPAVAEGHALVDQLVAELCVNSQSLGGWAAALQNVLHRLYRGRVLQTQTDADRELIAATRALESAFGELDAIPPALQPATSLATAVHLLLAPVRDVTIPPVADEAAVEMLGWLELALDDAPALVVTSFNEGIVPTSHQADAFLPDRLREHLGLIASQRQYARDLYATHVILASRPEATFIVGKRDADGNPLAPSRLLFAAPPEVAAARARRLFRAPATRPPRRAGLSATPPPEVTTLEVPPPQVPADWELNALSVTRFRTYLACKYRFYLAHLLDLVTLSDDAAELDPGAFGNVLHAVLEELGRAPEVHASDDARKILRFLEDQLHKQAHARYGRLRRGAINLQLEQARARLEAFATWQAQRTAEGWQIAYVETERQQLQVDFPVDGLPLVLKGRIDRIDWHPRQQLWQVLDYKTADAGKAPEAVHRRPDGDGGKRWVDLQLPLYRHLAAGIGLSGGAPLRGNISLGYILLPKDVSQVGLSLAEWTADDLASADETARQVIRDIRSRDFWPPTMPPPDYAEDFAAICQDNVLDKFQPALSADEEGAAP
jgi:hypothetical protein